MKAWKHAQEIVAEKFGGEVLKKKHYGHSIPDVRTSKFLFEVKSKERIPKCIENPCEKYRHEARRRGLTPVAAYVEKHKKCPKIYLVFDADEYLELHPEDKDERRKK